jgi:hypothetical protein
MITAATTGSVFATVVVVVGIGGIVASVVVLLRQRDPFKHERGSLWMFHGQPEDDPIRLEGTSYEERHAIDPGPEPAEPRADKPQPVA